MLINRTRYLLSFNSLFILNHWKYSEVIAIPFTSTNYNHISLYLSDYSQINQNSPLRLNKWLINYSYAAQITWQIAIIMANKISRWYVWSQVIHFLYNANVLLPRFKNRFWNVCRILWTIKRNAWPMQYQKRLNYLSQVRDKNRITFPRYMQVQLSHTIPSRSQVCA